MKKYVKPELFYERFELTEHIAACDFDPVGTTNGGQPSSCAFVGDKGTDWEGMVVFTDTAHGCVYVYEEYCYYTGANGMNTFNS